ncbi:MAG: ATP-dependent helicase [Candidatus Eremiobacteraeota bacterium]|nr:ATP-dependent helicase [Candidatus Eremiobacteraeota bacterium]
MIPVLALERTLDLPAEHPLIVFSGFPNSGKTEALVRRFAALVAAEASLAQAAIVTAARPDGALALAARISAASGLAVRGATLDVLALELLRAHPLETGLALDLETIDPLDAQEIFERAAAPLFSAEWSDWLGPEVDPEIAGLRMPDRFAVAALRLIRKLREAGKDPDAFLELARRGATQFYSNPPNLAGPELIAATKEEHRVSLTVDARELERQWQRELDLAKILARLYRAYVDELVRHGCLTPNDALVEATRLIEARPAIARALRRRLRVALVDDAHDLPAAATRFLQHLFGDGLPGVTAAGEPSLATSVFTGARTEWLTRKSVLRVELPPAGLPPQIAAVMRAVIHGRAASPIPAGSAVRVVRLADHSEEASTIAALVERHVARGTPPGRIAVLHRTLRTLLLVEDALVDRGIPVALAGDPALFMRPDVLDALALLWSAVDPFRHVWLLRALQAPLLRLSDASIAILCGEPASPQPALFTLADEPADDRHWDRRRELRLATNVLGGERDADLPPLARDRIAAFRERRARWSGWLAQTSPADAARAIVEDGALLAPRSGETEARARRRAALVGCVLDEIARYGRRRPFASLGDALEYCERVASAQPGPEIDEVRDDAVAVAAVDRVLGRRFEHVIITDVRAGAFPPYYVPDAFLFSPAYGMIPKDCAGDAAAARTAKYTWYEYRYKPKEAYANEQRRLLAAAMGRADATVTITASGRVTKGRGAPELAAEIKGFLTRVSP